MTVATYQTLNFGSNPTLIDGPSTLGSGVIVPNFKAGHVAYGDCESEYVYVKVTLGSTAAFLPGQLYVVDDDYNATLISTTNSPRGSKVVVCQANSLGAQPVGVYYLWMLRAGQSPVAYTTLTTNNLTETTATAGALNSPSTPTTTSKLISGLYFTKAPATFTATVTNGSTVLTGPFTGVSTGSGPFAGAAISGTGIAGGATIAAVNVAGNVVQSITMSAAATASGSAIVVTPSLVGEARVMWPFVDKTN